MNEELREALARAMFESDYGGTDFYWEDLVDGPDTGRNYYRRHADAVLALPEVAALLADGERVRRVREVLRYWEVAETTATVMEIDVRHALDVDPS